MSSLKVTIESTKANRLICSKVYTHTPCDQKRCVYEKSVSELCVFIRVSAIWIKTLILPFIVDSCNYKSHATVCLLANHLFHPQMSCGK